VKLCGFSIDMGRDSRIADTRLFAEINFRKAPHPVPLPIRWGEGDRRLGEGFSGSFPEICFGNRSRKSAFLAASKARLVVYICRKAAAMGSRAARIAGNNPPIRPIMTAQNVALTSSCGVTAKAKAIWLNVCQLIVAAL